jgi:hypothetical protein
MEDGLPTGFKKYPTINTQYRMSKFLGKIYLTLGIFHFTSGIAETHSDMLIAV